MFTLPDNPVHTLPGGWVDYRVGSELVGEKVSGMPDMRKDQQILCAEDYFLNPLNIWSFLHIYFPQYLLFRILLIIVIMAVLIIFLVDAKTVIFVDVITIMIGNIFNFSHVCGMQLLQLWCVFVLLNLSPFLWNQNPEICSYYVLFMWHKLKKNFVIKFGSRWYLIH